MDQLAKRDNFHDIFMMRYIYTQTISKIYIGTQYKSFPFKRSLKDNGKLNTMKKYLN